MSKNLILMAALAILATGCSQEQEIVTSRDINDAITFEAYTGRSAVSRATQLTSDNLDKFYVFATQHEGAINTDSKCDGFMSNLPIRKVEAGWDYSPLKYWENDNDRHVSFFAVAGDEPNGDDSHVKFSTMPHSQTEASTHIAIYTFNFEVDDEVTKQVDFIWAKTLNQKHSDRAKDEKGTIEMKFNHALAAIGFTVKLNENYGDVDIHLKKVTITGDFYKSGTLNLSVPDPQSQGTGTSGNEQNVSAPISGSRVEWNDCKPSVPVENSNDNNRTFTIYDDTNGLLLGYEKKEGETESTPKTYNISGTTYTVENGAAVEQPNNAYLMVIPQTFTKNGNPSLPKINVEYTVTQGLTNPQANIITTDFPLPSGESIAFQAGKLYMVNMTVKLDAITFTHSMTEWSANKTDINTTPSSN